MAALIPQTPQRPVPGTFFNTPAANRRPSSTGPVAPLNFNVQSTAPAMPAQASQQSAELSNANATNVSSTSAPLGLSEMERAARTVNATLNEEGKYPALDSYISQGYSSEYDLSPSPAWAPFQKIKMYEIPERILDQFNQAQVSTMMGLFADLNHAWISIDNSLYIWDYTQPNPEIIGFEEQPHTITAVKLVTPRAGVFVPTIVRLLLVATTSDIILIGVSTDITQSGAKTIALFNTGMQVSVRGLDVRIIEGSAKTGRIFFGGRADDDVYEITYQQEEKWFQPSCSKVNHLRKGFYDSVVPSLFFQGRKGHEYLSQIVVDDSRQTLYTLSSHSTIRVFSLKNPTKLELSTTRTLQTVMNDLGHKVGQSSLLSKNTSIVSINPISSQEASRINLLAITSDGCRIFFSAVTSHYFGSAADTAATPTSMQVHHVKFPPREGNDSRSQPSSQYPGQAVAFPGTPAADISKSLTRNRMSIRIQPGYFICFVEKSDTAIGDTVFMSAPDSGRIARPQDPAQMNKFPEFGSWLALESQAQDIGLVTPPFAASATPVGFGNELAVQFEQPASEFAVLTNAGVHTFRRRRLVDVFAAAIRFGGGDDGLEGEIRHFVRTYGRAEVIATALAVACGQGSDVTADARVARITDPEIIDYARRTFVEHGGRPVLNENSVVDQGSSLLDNVRPSPRHDGLARYVSRLLRPIWRAPIILEVTAPGQGVQIKPRLPLPKLLDIQQNLTRVQEFLNANKSFIEGLAAPDDPGRATQQEAVALRAEHRALDSLVKLIANVIEGIAFVLVLFDEHVEEIITLVSNDIKDQVRKMTYESLFCTPTGKDIAKELVKAIVNKNITNGSNVDTVTDALRRKCGSFCSADDCVIFKAQEQLKRASDSSASSELSRNLLNESLRLLQRVAGSLSMEQLRWAIYQYIPLEFFAGAIQLALSVARENDRGGEAVKWITAGSPPQDSNGAQAYAKRVECYGLIHDVIVALDHNASQHPDMIDGQFTVTAKRKQEAYDVINDSEDQAFQMNLYDWYLSQGWVDRLLNATSPFVEDYLKRKSLADVAHADLLWRYYAQYNNFLEAARVQLQLAKSSFELTLEQRIEYLSRARANASTKSIGLMEHGRSRQSRQELIREISDFIDIANVQDDLLRRIKSDPRLTAERRPQVIKQLNGQVLSVDELYNGFADQANYHDICLMIYQIADYRNAADIRATWQNLLEWTHQQVTEDQDLQPWEAIADKIRSLGQRLQLSESTFPVATLIPILERYSFEYQRNVGPATWVVDIFLDLQVPFEPLIAVLESMLYSEEVPFSGRNKRYIATDTLRVIQQWFASTAQSGPGGVLGGDENAVAISQTLQVIQQSGLNERQAREAQTLQARIDQLLR